MIIERDVNSTQVSMLALHVAVYNILPYVALFHVPVTIQLAMGITSEPYHISGRFTCALSNKGQVAGAFNNLYNKHLDPELWPSCFIKPNLRCTLLP